MGRKYSGFWNNVRGNKLFFSIQLPCRIARELHLGDFKDAPGHLLDCLGIHYCCINSNRYILYLFTVTSCSVLKSDSRHNLK